uniref:Zgc: n=1 Tax=Caenorhabditis tropicalis TaxID=1561998 RepID=A0A1I7TB08_9PELO
MSEMELVEKVQKQVVEKMRPAKMSGGFKLYDDAVTIHFSMKEATSDFLDKKSHVNKVITRHRFESARATASMVLEPEVKTSADGTEDHKMEVKITINMKQLEKHHRDIESYISPFTPSPDSIFLRIPPRPQDFALVENARDELDKLVAIVYDMTPHVIPEKESRDFLKKLRKLDVRLTALYPRQPAPGDKEKKSYRMCPCFEPEMADIHRQINHFNEVFHSMNYLYGVEQYLQHQLERRQKNLARREELKRKRNPDQALTDEIEELLRNTPEIASA